MKEFFQNFNSVNEFNYSVHISDQFRFVYFNNPKCACTSIKASLNLTCAAALGRHLEYRGIGDIHDRRQNILLSPADIGYPRFKEILTDRSYFKFCFMREPVDRLVSAFASKLTWKSESLVALNRRLGRAECAPMAFLEFVQVLSSDEQIREMDEHWRLQHKQMCLDFVRFDKIGLFENLESDLEEVLQRVFGAAGRGRIFDVRRHFPGNVSNARTLMEALSKDTRATIKQIYEGDVHMYLRLSEVAKISGDT